MKVMEHKCKVDTRDKLLRQIFDVAGCVNDSAVLCRFKNSLEK
jgi:hypothetical protein